MSSSTPFPTTSLRPPWVEYQSWALSALRSVFSAPLCTCNMTSGQHQQRSLLCFPFYKSPHVTSTSLLLLCQTMSHSHRQLICAQRYYCGTEPTGRGFTVAKEPAVFCPLLTERLTEWTGSVMHSWRVRGKLWSGDTVASTKCLLLWCYSNNWTPAGATARHSQMICCLDWNLQYVWWWDFT